MSIRQKIIKYGNMTSQIQLALATVSFFLFRDRDFALPLHLSWIAFFAVTILGGNYVISKLKKKILVTKSMLGQNSFIVSDDMREVVIVIAWQYGDVTIRRKAFTYTVVLTMPDGKVRTEHFRITNNSKGSIYLYTSDSWDLELMNPKPGHYSIRIESDDDTALSYLKELSIGGWE